MTDLQAASARIKARLGGNFARLEATGPSPATAEAFAAFLARPKILKRPSLIVRYGSPG